DAQVFGFAHGVLELAVRRDRARDGGHRLIRFAARDVNFGEAGDRLGGELLVAQTLGFANGDLGDLERAVQLALRPAHDTEIVARFGDAAAEIRLLVGRDRARVRVDRTAVVALHVRDDAEVVGAAADGCLVLVVRRLSLRA